MHWKRLIRQLFVLVAVVVLGLTDLQLPSASAGPEQPAVPAACHCGDHCTCTGDMSCCTEGTCGIEERKLPVDAMTATVRPLPPFLLSLSLPEWHESDETAYPAPMASYPDPISPPPDRPPWRLG